MVRRRGLQRTTSLRSSTGHSRMSRAQVRAASQTRLLVAGRVQSNAADELVTSSLIEPSGEHFPEPGLAPRGLELAWEREGAATASSSFERGLALLDRDLHRRRAAAAASRLERPQRRASSLSAPGLPAQLQPPHSPSSFRRATTAPATPTSRGSCPRQQSNLHQPPSTRPRRPTRRPPDPPLDPHLSRATPAAGTMDGQQDWIELSAHYNGGYVVLSYLVSFVGAWTTLEMLLKRTGSTGLWNVMLLFGAGIAFGSTATFGMHFVRRVPLSRAGPVQAGGLTSSSPCRSATRPSPSASLRPGKAPAHPSRTTPASPSSRSSSRASR